MAMQEIIEGNKLIAKFMGWEVSHSTRPNTVFPSKVVHEITSYSDGGQWQTRRSLHGDEDLNKAINDEWDLLLNPKNGRAGKFHTSWNKLMPVVEKIQQTAIVEISFSVAASCRIVANLSKIKSWQTVYESNSPIEAVFKSVIEFIKWHNEQKDIQQLQQPQTV